MTNYSMLFDNEVIEEREYYNRLRDEYGLPRWKFSNMRIFSNVINKYISVYGDLMVTAHVQDYTMTPTIILSMMIDETYRNYVKYIKSFLSHVNTYSLKFRDVFMLGVCVFNQPLAYSNGEFYHTPQVDLEEYKNIDNCLLSRQFNNIYNYNVFAAPSNRQELYKRKVGM